MDRLYDKWLIVSNSIGIVLQMAEIHHGILRYPVPFLRYPVNDDDNKAWKKGCFSSKMPKKL